MRSTGSLAIAQHPVRKHKASALGSRRSRVSLRAPREASPQGAERSGVGLQGSEWLGAFTS